MAETCSVCIEEFTKQAHKKRAQCPYCDVTACTSCTQKYLASTTDDPHCMGCRKAWTREVMDTILLTTWINGEYKKHRENILLDRERSRLPAAQLIIERQKMAKEYEPARTKVQSEINELDILIQTKYRQINDIHRIIATYSRGEDPFVGNSTKTIERRTFTMACPVEDCRGFLSQNYKCGLCDARVCSECREVKNMEEGAPAHICKPEIVESVKLMKKDTRSCPDCGTGIFKIDGCDQMFCTNCKTAFSWNTGKKVTTGMIHNPHYFEYLRATNGGVMPRNPGDIPCGANLPTPWAFQTEVIRRFTKLPPTLTDWLYQALRTIIHIQHVEIPRLINNAEDTDNTEYNLKYLNKDIDEKRWKQLLQQREKRRLKRDEVRMRYEAFVGACIDIYGAIIQESRNIYAKYNTTPVDRRDIRVPTINEQDAHSFHLLIKKSKVQLENLGKIFNEGMITISKRYKCRVLQVSDVGYAMSYKKYDSGRIKNAKKADDESVGLTDDDEPKNTIVAK